MKDKKNKPIIGILNKIVMPDIEKHAIGEECEIECLNAKCEDDLPSWISKYDAVILSYRLTLSAKTIDKMINCQAIVCASVGYDNVDYMYAAQKGIRVYNIPDYGTNDVADHAFALFLSYARRIILYDRLLCNDVEKNWNATLVKNYHRLTNTSVGIIGLGRIGTAFALRAKAFGMKVYYFDPYKSSGYDRALQIHRAESLEYLFEHCKVISIHAPLTSETNQMLNYDLFKKSTIKPILINTARGNIVNTRDVCDAIKTGLIEAYLTDVLDEEPPQKSNALYYYASDPILCEKIIITPHSASYAEESQYDMRFKAAEIAISALRDSSLMLNCVNNMEVDYGLSYIN